MVNKRFVVGAFAFAFVLIAFFFFNSPFLLYSKLQKNKPLKPAVYVYTYSSFISQWGVGKYIKTEFEKTCNCRLHWVRAGDARMILRRMQLLGNDRVDLVIGLDQFSMLEAASLFSWKKVNLKARWVKAIKNSSVKNPLIGTYFFPYDWSPMGFIYKKGLKNIPQSFGDLLNPKLKNKIALQNPLTSSAGLQFLIHLNLSVKKPPPFLKQLRKQVGHISNSWSKSYTLFKANYRDIVFSYLSSIAYHIIEENNPNYKMAIFKSPHPYQIEMMAIPNRCKNCLLAKKLLAFLLTKKVQKQIMFKNFMFPVIKGVSDHSVFAKLTKPALLDYFINKKLVNTSLQFWKKYFLHTQ
ncbi:MAG: thiamine ABC transporter substrate-binding protein [Bdellovibrionaceae bacterium]|nr:thiamine ABC transporter substrate-binding protein [Pseudobdellovibrionaceae bacterium]